MKIRAFCQWHAFCYCRLLSPIAIADPAAGNPGLHLDQRPDNAKKMKKTGGMFAVAIVFGGLVVLGAGSAGATVYRSFDGTANNPDGLGAAGTESFRHRPTMPMTIRPATRRCLRLPTIR